MRKLIHGEPVYVSYDSYTINATFIEYDYRPWHVDSCYVRWSCKARAKVNRHWVTPVYKHKWRAYIHMYAGAVRAWAGR